MVLEYKIWPWRSAENVERENENVADLPLAANHQRLPSANYQLTTYRQIEFTTHQPPSFRGDASSIRQKGKRHKCPPRLYCSP